MIDVLLTCGHLSGLRESALPNALWFCETCQCWQEREEMSPPPFRPQLDLIGDAEQRQRADYDDGSHGQLLEDLPDWDASA